MARVLVVGDDLCVVELVAQSLTIAGCQTEATVSVPEAMKLLAAGQFDFVVVDRPRDGDAVAQIIDAYHRDRSPAPDVLAPGPAVFRLDYYLTPVFRRVRYVTDAVVAAVEYRAFCAHGAG